MKKTRKWSINKILIIVAIVLAVIAIIATSIFFVLKNNQKEEPVYNGTAIPKNLFNQITVNMLTKEVRRDSKETTMRQEFGIDKEKEREILSTQETLTKFVENSAFEIEFKDGIAYLTNKYQTRKLIVDVKELKGKFNGTESVDEIGEGIYILTYDTPEKTKKAYESLSKISWFNNVEIDEVLRIRTISDESQTVYGKEEKKEDSDDRVYGVKAMGLDNYKKIIQENGNPKDVTVATIGYGAEIKNTYFGGRISDKSFNFIKNSSEVYETIPQGSRILEVIQESTSHNVKIMPLMVVDEENYTTTANILQALKFAKGKSDVICYELVHKEINSISKTLKSLFKENIPVCAVTTSEVSSKDNYPANDSTTIAVASIDKSNKVTTFSGSGEYIDFSSYSTDVEEILNTSTSISKWSGAEYSNAQIVSAIALIKTYHKEYTILQIYDLLKNYCKDLGEEGKDEVYGYGTPNFSELKISDIDKKAPEIEEIKIDDENWEKSKEIQIKAKDDIRILGWAITEKDEEPKELNKLETLSSTLDTKSKLEKNGKYYIWVSDSGNNFAKKEIEVQKIDSKEPKIEYTIDDENFGSEKYVTINIKGTDEESGLNENAYSWDGTAWGKENNSLKVTANGTYTAYIRDKMENIAQKEITVDMFPKQGNAIIEDGNIIKEINVSSEWEGDTNKNVRITFNNNINISMWRITETNIMPKEFEQEGHGSELDEENSVVLENTDREDSSGVQGYSNLIVTVSLKTNTQYFVWIKKDNGNVDIQSFRIEK